MLEHAIAINGPSAEVLAVVGDMALEHEHVRRRRKNLPDLYRTGPGQDIGHNNLATAIGTPGQAATKPSRCLREIIPMFPESPLLWNTLGTSVAGREGYETAMPFYQEAYRLEPQQLRAPQQSGAGHRQPRPL